VDHFVRRFREKRGKQIHGVSEEVLALLRRYDWPGNVRELENAIEHAFVMCRGETIVPAHLPEKVVSAGSAARPVRTPLSESAILREALDRNHGNRSATARELGIHRATLWRKLRQYGLG
jgi:DNA-binding NtrC family response regulator